MNTNDNSPIVGDPCSQTEWRLCKWRRNGNRLEERVAVLGTADRPFVISYLGHVSRGRIIVALKDSQSRHWERLNDRDKLPPAIYPFSRTVGRKFSLLLANWRVWWYQPRNWLCAGKLWIIVNDWDGKNNSGKEWYRKYCKVEDCGDAKKRINLSVLLKFLKITISRTIMNPMCKVKQ